MPAETYSYDKTGNRLSATVGSDTKSYSHNANNEMTAVGSVTYSYDANGNTTIKTSGGQTTTLIYNSADRLETVQLPDGRTAIYTYDPFGRRIKKQLGSETTFYLYSDEGLIGEYDAGGNLKKGYGWQPDGIWGTNPLFMTENGKYYFYQNDHLGTPHKISDESGNVVWSATYSSFGNAFVDPASTITNSFRFPGQYFDEESGLHYNWNRYYDPENGSYTQDDPIGFISGDLNLYGYAGLNPVNAYDPDGLDWLDNLANVSAGFGDTISLGITKKIRDALGTNSVLDPCSRWYSGGEVAGVVHSLLMGGAGVAKGAFAMGGRSGSLLTRFRRGISRFFSDSRQFETVSKQYWRARGGANGWHLHHWWRPRRAGGTSAGWSLLELPGAFNSWMGYSKIGQFVEQWIVRPAIPSALAGGAIQGAKWGLEKDDWKNNCKEKCQNK